MSRMLIHAARLALVGGVLISSLVGRCDAAAGAAGKEPERDLNDLSLEELMQIEVPTVYGASKREQKTTEAPSSVSIVTRADIQQYGYRTLSDILNRVRGFYVTYDRGYSYIGVRGFNRPGDYGGRILLMVDGHRLNDGIYDTAASGWDFPLDVDLIERVEIIRGPGSSLYGNNAFFAVINVITRRGREMNGAELALSYGSFESWTGRASYGQRFANGVELLVSGTLYDSAGQNRLHYPEFVAEELDGGWARNLFASIAYQDLALQGGYQKRQKDWPTAAYDTVPNSQDPRLFTEDQRAWADLKFEHAFGDRWLLKTRGYFDRYQFDGDYPYDYDADPATPPDTNRDLAIATSAGLESSLNTTLWDSHRLTVGGEGRRDFELLQKNYDVDPRLDYLDSDERATIFGLYAQDEWRIRENLILSAGLRYDHYSTFGGTVNPRAALIYSPWAPTTFKFLYGQAFRAPNAYELYYAAYTARANPDLDPETIRSYELVWEQRFGSRWRTSVSGFWNEVKDLINQEVYAGADPLDASDDLFFFDNTGSALARGVELEVEGRLPAGWRSVASYTYVDTEDKTTGGQLDNAPHHLGKVNLSIPLWGEKISAGLETQVTSSRKTVGGGHADAYTITNVTVLGRELVKGLELSASVYNLFDQDYAHPTSADFNYTGPVSGDPIQLDAVAQDGRTFRVKLVYRF